MAAHVATLSADAALARGWCLMERDRPLEAVGAFDVALEKGGPKVREDAAYGKSLAYLRENLTDAAAVAATEAPLTGPRQAELTVELLTRRALEAFDAGRWTDAIMNLDRRARLAPEQTDLMMLRAYAYRNIGHRADARRIFEALALAGVADARAGIAALENPD